MTTISVVAKSEISLRTKIAQMSFDTASPESRRSNACCVQSGRIAPLAERAEREAREREEAKKSKKKKGLFHYNSQ
tara:strand:- start:1979 stop:2206 length:228 start_codon:yes stop_codon:yes gene_type:complete